MKINERRLLLLSIAFPVYLFLLWLVSRPVLGQFYFNNPDEKGLVSAVSYDSRNATYYYMLGRLCHYSSENPDLTKAVEYYRKSIRLSPLQGGCWLDLAKAYQTLGMSAYAGEAIERAIMLLPRNPAVMWEAGVFYLVHDNIGRSVKNFREFILLKPERQEAVYDMLWKIPVNPQYVLKNLIPYSYPYYKGYFFYLISTDRVDESGDLWKMIKGFTPVEDELYLKYTDFLISKHIYDDADNIWKSFTGKKFQGKKEEQPSLIWNGSFEYDMLNGGFDWKVSETKGVDVFLDSDIHLLGSRSLGVTFDGTQNPDITIASQVVRAIPGAKYTLRGSIKTDSLTTANGLFLSVEGHDCSGFYKKSDVITGTNFWREVYVEFDVPPGCSTLTIKVRRERSNKLDNKINGSAWIDGVSLTQG